jgi:phosphoglycerate dehydrogenase-like enzyme
MTEKKKVVITLETTHDRYEDIFQADITDDLRARADVVLNKTGRAFTTQELAQRCADADAIITTWGAPHIDMSVVSVAPKLKIIAHAAGTVKGLIAPEVWDAGITVTNAASAIATYVGEFALLATLALLRTLPKHTYGAPRDYWDEAPCDAWETLIGKTVGLIGLGNTARAFIKCLAPFDCKLIAYDPYVSSEKAAEMGVELVSLESLLSTAKVVSLHAAVTNETIRMLDSHRLGFIKDGAVLVNTARGALIDHDALADELERGRFKAALDVTDPEPLPQDHRLRALPNCLLTPHTAGPTKDGRRDLFRCVVDDLKLFWGGQAPRNLVTKQMLATMA